MRQSNLENSTQLQNILPNYTKYNNRNAHMTHTQTETYKTSENQIHVHQLCCVLQGGRGGPTDKGCETPFDSQCCQSILIWLWCAIQSSQVLAERG